MEQQKKLEQIVPERSARFSFDPWKFSRHVRPFLEEKNCPPGPPPLPKGGSWCQKSDWKVKGLTGVTRDARVTMAFIEGDRGGEEEWGGGEGKDVAQVIQVIQVVQVVRVVRIISLDYIHSENIQFLWSKPSNYR